MIKNFELAGYTEIAKGFNPYKFEREFQRQQSDTAGKTRTLISQQVRRMYKVKAGLLGGGKLGAKIQKLPGKRVISYKGNMIGLDHMSMAKTAPKGTPKRAGVKVTVKQGNRTLVKGGFQGSSRDRKRQFVYKRVTDASGKTLKTRTGKDKLERLRTISIAHMVEAVPITKNTREVFNHFEKGLKKRLARIA